MAQKRSFYVTVKDGKRTGWLLGPFNTHDEALAQVDTGAKLARSVDPKASFYAFGTSSISAPIPPLGVLNSRANIPSLQTSR